MTTDTTRIEIELRRNGDVPVMQRIIWFLLRVGGKYTIPATWNDLTGKQLVMVAQNVFSGTNQYVARLMIFHHLTRMPMIALEWISDEMKLHLTDQVIWVFDIGNITLTKQLLPKYGGLYGPGDKFSNVTVGEFFFADSFFLQYNKTKNVKMLDHLVAIMYRKRIVDIRVAEVAGDVRQEFNNNTIDKRVELIAKWPMEVKQAILLYYIGCRNDVVAKYYLIFDSVTEEKVTAEKAEIQTIYPYITLYAGKWGGVPGAMKVKIHSFLSDVQINLKLKKQASRK